MIFKGYSRTFSTQGEQQYQTIGEFWNEMSKLFGIENLRGLGFNWTDSTIEYVIGLKNNQPMNMDITDEQLLWKEIVIPDSEWMKYHGQTEQLGELYSKIYNDGVLTYEIEEFNEDGTCDISITRNK